MNNILKVKKSIVCIFICFALFATIFGENIVTGSDEWPLFGQNAANTRYTSSKAPATNQTFLKKQIVSDVKTYTDGQPPTELDFYPVVGNGKLYFQVGYSGFGNLDQIIGINAGTGSSFFKKSLPGDYSFSYSVAIDNNQVYAPRDVGLVCMNATDGTVKWTYPAAGVNTPIVAENKIYFCNYYKLYCITPDGTGVWNASIQSDILTPPAFANNKIYFVAPLFSGPVSIYCLDATTGAQIWIYTLENNTSATSPVVADGKVFVGVFDYLNSGTGRILCLNATGNSNGTTRVLWSVARNPSSQDAKSLAVAEGHVYGIEMSDNGGQSVFCLDATTGASVWNYEFLNEYGLLTAPSIADAKVYVSGRNTVYCLDAVGNDDETTDLIWSYRTTSSNPEYERFLSPIISQGKVWVCLANLVSTQIDPYNGKTIYLYGVFVYGFGSEQPPATPDTPTGSAAGFVDQELTFSTKTTDPDSSDYVWYQWKFGLVTTDWIGPYDSGVDVSQSYTWNLPGMYQVTVRAKDLYSESSWSPSFFVNITDQSVKQLTMSVTPSTIIAEGDSFQVTVYSNNVPLDQVTVSFAGQTYITGSNGVVSIAAPPVEKKTLFLLVASHAGYESTSATITILDTSSSSIGFIYGVVSSTDGFLLTNVQISISLSGGETKQTFSDSEGKYVLSAPRGSCSVEVKKVGYKTVNVPSFVVVERQAIENNVVLEKEQVPTSGSGENTEIIDYILTQEISKGTIGAQVTVIPHEVPQISYYADELTLDVTSGDEKVFCTVNAPDGTGAMVMVVHIKRGVLPDLSDLRIVVDDVQIVRETDVEAFFDLSDSSSRSESSWLQFTAEGETYALIKITHFSAHTITISSIVETISGILAFSFYIIISAIILAVFFSPMLMNIIRRRRSLQK